MPPITTIDVPGESLELSCTIMLEAKLRNFLVKFNGIRKAVSSNPKLIESIVDGKQLNMNFTEGPFCRLRVSKSVIEGWHVYVYMKE